MTMQRRTFLTALGAVATLGAAAVIRDEGDGYPDRISAENPNHSDALVFVGGRQIYGAFEADRKEGWVKHFEQERGPYAHSPAVHPMRELIMYGIVTFQRG